MDLTRQKEVSVVQERERLHRETITGFCLAAVPHHLNSTEFFW